MSWSDALVWADTLVYGGYSDWRLPTALNPDGTLCMEYVCSGSELGHLYYVELGNPVYGPLTNVGPFIHLQSYLYWSSTEYTTTRAISFNFTYGRQIWGDKTGLLYAVAVRDGDVLVPEPSTLALLLAGGIVLAGGADRKRNARSGRAR